MQPLDYYRPKDFAEAFQYLNLPGKTVYPVAGATDLIPSYRDGVWKMDAVVDVKGLEGMRDIKETPDGLFIGAAVKMNELALSPLVKSHCDILAQGAAVVGSDQVRNRATIAGNLVTASPCADTPPTLSALDAIIVIRSADGERRVSATGFATFVRKTVLKPGELIVGVIIPQLPAGSIGIYEKLSRRRGCDLSLVSVAALAVPSGKGYNWRIALGAVAPTSIRVPSAEAILAEGHDEAHVEKAAQAAAETARPISDVRASEQYRKAMVANITKRAIRNVLAKLK